MCDTMLAVGSATKSENVIFAKNSDREPNESQIILNYIGQKQMLS